MFNSKIIALVLLMAGGFSMGACSNTLSGAGQDIENAGENIQDAAK